jgi:hypothetical protein
MGVHLSKIRTLIFGPDPQEMAWEAVAKGDDKLLAQALQAKGRFRVLVNKRDPTRGGRTLLSLASESGYRKLVQLLLEKMADPNITTDNGFTALCLALKNGHDGCAQVIINSSKDVNLDTSDSVAGNTPLLWAVEKDCTAATIQLLVEKGADLEAKSRQGLTALMIATDQNNADKVRVLLKAGANPRTQDLRAGTALSRAREKNYNIVGQLLEQAIVAKGGSVDKTATSSGANDSRGPVNSTKKRDPLAKGALGSQVADVYSTGRGVALEKDTREKTKDIKYASVSLDSALKSSMGGPKN